MKLNDEGLVPNQAAHPTERSSRTFYVKHVQRIAFDVPVFCEPTLIRLHPRSDKDSVVRRVRLDVTPRPAGVRHATDAHGNDVWQVRFGDLTIALSISVTSCVERTESIAQVQHIETIRFDQAVAARSSRYSHTLPQESTSADIADLVDAAHRDSDGSQYDLCRQLASRVAEKFKADRPARHASAHSRSRLRAGHSVYWPAAESMAAAARSLEVPTRLVRGYCGVAADEIETDMRVWCEFDLAGLGWYGFDPVTGQPIDATYIPVAAGQTRESTCSVSGQYRGTSRQPETSTQIILREAAQSSPRMRPTIALEV